MWVEISHPLFIPSPWVCIPPNGRSAAKLIIAGHFRRLLGSLAIANGILNSVIQKCALFYFFVFPGRKNLQFLRNDGTLSEIHPYLDVASSGFRVPFFSPPLQVASYVPQKWEDEQVGENHVSSSLTFDVMGKSCREIWTPSLHTTRGTMNLPLHIP